MCYITLVKVNGTLILRPRGRSYFTLDIGKAMPNHAQKYFFVAGWAGQLEVLLYFTNLCLTRKLILSVWKNAKDAKLLWKTATAK